MSHRSNNAIPKQLAQFNSPRQEAQFMIDKGQHTRFARTLSHTSRFNRVHRHRFFAENCFAVLQSCERHLTMLNGRGDDAYEIDIITSNKGAPVTVYVLDV